MKKVFLSLLIAASFAANATEDVNRIILQNFKADFKYAKNVSWTNSDQFVKARFTEMDVQMEAFYTPSGELIGVSKNAELESLPKNSAKYILSKYASYKMGEVIAYESATEGLSHFVSLEDGKEKLVLEIGQTGSVSVFKRTWK